jgi:hypothetical protein
MAAASSSYQQNGYGSVEASPPLDGSSESKPRGWKNWLSLDRIALVVGCLAGGVLLGQQLSGPKYDTRWMNTATDSIPSQQTVTVETGNDDDNDNASIWAKIKSESLGKQTKRYSSRGVIILLLTPLPLSYSGELGKWCRRD